MDPKQTKSTPPGCNEEENGNIGESSDAIQNGGAITANVDPTVVKYIQEKVDILTRQEELREQIKTKKEIIKKQNEELMKSSKTILELKANKSQMKKKRAGVIKKFNHQKEKSQNFHGTYEELCKVLEGYNKDKEIINEQFDKIVNAIEQSELLQESSEQEHRRKVEMLNLKINNKRKAREQIDQANKELQAMFDGITSKLKDQFNSQKLELEKVAELRNQISIKRQTIQMKKSKLNEIHEKLVKLSQVAGEYKLKQEKKTISSKEKIESLQRKSKELTDEMKTVIENRTTIEAEGNDLLRKIENCQREVDKMRELIKVTEHDLELKKELENQKTSTLKVVEDQKIKIQEKIVANVDYENKMKLAKEELANLDKQSKQEDEEWEKEKRVLLDTIVMEKDKVLKRKEDLRMQDYKIANLESQIANINLEIEKEQEKLKICKNQAEKRMLAQIEKCVKKLASLKIETKEKSDKIEGDNIQLQLKSTESMALEIQIVELKKQLKKLSFDAIDLNKSAEAATDEPEPSKNQTLISPTVVRHADSNNMETNTSGFTRNPRTASLRKRFNNGNMEFNDSCSNLSPDSPEYTPQKSTTNQTAHSSNKKKRQFFNL